ncbi:hypothetical protein [Neisseria sp. Marseille-Q6792]|uniref:hypothetical protein n=1 Tax=Neisseria sp. Marseille-Q6792 TaxID=2937985 RepID=UPI00202483C5|nr:hypothetical protein [Neisseria sp. Marseille-Q6792]
MPSETLSDRFRRHSPIPLRRFSGRFLLNAKYPVIPAPQPTFPPSFPHHPHRFKSARKLFRVIPAKAGI